MPACSSQPSWHDALLATVKLPAESVWRDKAYIYMAIGVVGTTIAPWMQFYLQSSIVEKGIRVKDYAASRLDVIVGSFFTDLIAWFIVVACAATLFVHGMGAIQVAADAAEAMRPLAGDYAFHPLRLRPLQCLALRRLHPAALHGLHGLRRPRASNPASTRASKKRRSSTGSTRCSSPAAHITVLLLPDAQLINVAILSQVLNGVLLPVVIILMLLLINRKRPDGRAQKLAPLERGSPGAPASSSSA